MLILDTTGFNYGRISLTLWIQICRKCELMTQHVCKTADMLPFLYFLIPKVERYSGFIIFSPVFYCIYLFFPKRNPMEGIPLGFYAMDSSLVVVVLIWVVVLV